MKVFISHALKDSGLALQLADQLAGAGLTVLYPGTEIAPGENWAMKIGKALQRSEFIVFLFTPGAFSADWLRKEVEFALGSMKYEGRVFSVFVGPTLETGKDMPWILLRLPHRQVESAKKFGEVAKDIAALCTDAEAGSPHA
jgi:hypothetical protein